ncbi:MAG: sterol desaturase/sphingolipid hydroxylase (fatty acid hydroxylase superfamily) [Verrucomicrobiales bacterium]|jgi:sterol desaturase/sphingolipid hydroxylase (fatty acid hydroxylase superfamily)
MSRRRLWFFRLFAAAVVAGSLVFDRSPLLVIPLLFILVVPFEKLFPRHDQKIRREHLGLDLTYALGQPAIGVVSLVVGGFAAVVSLLWLPGLLFRPIVTALAPLAQILVGFFIFDLIIYWVHRWSHEVPFLWRFHSIHHSIETMDWVSAFRNHPVDGLIIAPAVAFMIAAGFSLEATAVLTVIQIVTGIFLHANVRWRWRPLHRIIITPDFHHWHHANEPDAINSNYSVFLPAWDMIFGTWFMPKDRRPQVYGVDEPVPPTMAAQMTYPFRGLQNPLWMFRHPIRGARYVLGQIRSGLGQLQISARRPRRSFHTSLSFPIEANHDGSLDSVTTG